MTMAKQIGWSQEANLLHAILRQLDQLAGVVASSGGGGGGGGSFVTTNTVQPITAQKNFSVAAGPAATFTSGTGNAVNITATTGSGVYSTSVDGPGVEGFSVNDPGIFGYSSNEPGVFSHSQNSVGFIVDSLNAANASDLAHFRANNVPVVRITKTGQIITNADATINGVRAGRGAGTGIDNVVFGINSLNIATTGEENTAFGFEALREITTGSYNTAIGWGALRVDKFGTQNVAIGDGALMSNTGVSGSNVSGARCTAIGTNSMAANTTGNGTAVGNNTLSKQTTGVWNIVMGTQAGANITTGNNNTIIATTGFAAADGITTGNNNLIIAQNLGHGTGITTGSGNTIVGKVTGLAAALANTVVISDGVGTQRFISDSTNLSRLPAQTNALITGDGTGKAILTKEYVPTAISSNVASNATAVALTLANLNATYPSALAGFKVHALSVGGGALIYEKTASGWCSYAVTVIV